MSGLWSIFTLGNVIILCCSDHGIAANVFGLMSPFDIQQYQENCTKKAELPCIVQVEENPCSPAYYVPVNGWPGPPEEFNVDVTYVRYQDSCVSKVNFTWIIPNDNSALSVKGFQLEILPASSLYLGIQMCVTLDLSEANWTVSDVFDQLRYSYSGTLMRRGDYFVSLSSLPRPDMGQIENKERNIRFTVQQSYFDGGECGITTTSPKPSPVTSRKDLPGPGYTVRHVTTPKTHISSGVRQPPSEHGFANFPVAIGSGVAGGVVLITILLVIILKVPWKKCTRQRQPLYEHLDDGSVISSGVNDHDGSEAIGCHYTDEMDGEDNLCSVSEIYNPICTCTNGRVFVPPIPPSDIDSCLVSEAAASINSRSTGWTA